MQTDYPVIPGVEWRTTDDYCRIRDLAAFEAYCIDGGWECIKTFEEEVGIRATALLNVWFIVIHSRVYLD